MFDGARLPDSCKVAPEGIGPHQLICEVRPISAPSRGPALGHGSARAKA